MPISKEDPTQEFYQDKQVNQTLLKFMAAALARPALTQGEADKILRRFVFRVYPPESVARGTLSLEEQERLEK